MRALTVGLLFLSLALSISAPPAESVLPSGLSTAQTSDSCDPNCLLGWALQQVRNNLCSAGVLC